jgi:hypothetical protein
MKMLSVVTFHFNPIAFVGLNDQQQFKFIAIGCDRPGCLRADYPEKSHFLNRKRTLSSLLQVDSTLAGPDS